MEGQHHPLLAPLSLVSRVHSVSFPQLLFTLLFPHLWLPLSRPSRPSRPPPRPPFPLPWSRPRPSPCFLCPPSSLPWLHRSRSRLPLLQPRRPQQVLQPRDLRGLARLAQRLQDSQPQRFLLLPQ